MSITLVVRNSSGIRITSQKIWLTAEDWSEVEDVSELFISGEYNHEELLSACVDLQCKECANWLPGADIEFKNIEGDYSDFTLSALCPRCTRKSQEQDDSSNGYSSS